MAAAVGFNAIASGDAAVAIGASATASGAKSVALGYVSVADRDKTFSIGQPGFTRQIINVAAGTQATDAVNYSQLQAAGLKVDTSGIATNSFVAYDDQTRNQVTLANTKITGVANGDVSASSKDVVNGAQLFAMQRNVAIGSLSNDLYGIGNAMASGQNAAAIGPGSYAGDNSVALGVASQAGTQAAGHATSVGYGANATGTFSTALGAMSSATAASSTALGFGAGATATNSVALGAMSKATRDNTVSVGSAGNERQIVNVKAGTQDTDAVNVAQLAGVQVSLKNISIGTGSPFSASDAAKTSGVDAIAIGIGASAGSTSTAMGRDAIAGSEVAGYAVSIGYQSNAGHLSTAIGANASASALRSTALGAASSASATNSVALGMGSKAIRDNTISVGSVGNERQIVNVKAGTQETDAVNVAQLHAAGLVIDSNGTVFNSFVAYDDTTQDTITLGGTNGSAIGNVQARPLASDSSYAVNGSQLFATGTSLAAALGGGSSLDANGQVLAPTFTVGGLQVHDVGSAVSYLDSNATRTSADISELKGVMSSNSADIAALKGVVNNAGVTPAPSPNVSADSVAYDTSEHNKLTLGGTTEGVSPVQLSNVLAGDLSISSTDAVNGAQLGATNERVSATETAVADYKSAGLDFVAVNSSSVNAAKPVASGSDSVAIGANAVASGDNSIALGANSIASDANTVSIGSSGNERRITNIAAGVNATDAVNVGQMSQLRTDMDASVRSLQRQAFGGIAAAMAMPNLAPSAPGKVVVAAGIGNYKGYSAIAAAATYRSPNGKWLANGGVSITPSGGTGIRGQVGYEF